MEEIKDAPPLQLILADGTVYAHPGKILYTDRQVDITTGTIRVASSFPNPENILRPGQFGRIRAATETVNGALLVPQKAVNELQGMYQIAVVGEGNKVSIRSVKVGDRSGENWIIQSGVKPGEMVIVEGLQKVRDGSAGEAEATNSASIGRRGRKLGYGKGRLDHVKIFHQPAHCGDGDFDRHGDRGSGDDYGAACRVISQHRSA